MKKLLSLVLALLLCLSLAACGADKAPAPTPAQPAQQEMPTAPEPAQEPEPEPDVYTPHEPLVFEGNGDDVVEMPLLDYYYAFHITGNVESRHFSVTTYDGSGNYNELLVNTSDPYDGVTYDMELNTELLEVSANGPWKIEVIDMLTLDEATAGQTYSGCGDYVLLVYNLGKTAEIDGNEASRHFDVISFGNHGEYLELLVNTSDPYSGKVLLKDDPAFLTISAVGDWSIQF